jgi:sec-independent protein translocase protein TatA
LSGLVHRKIRCPKKIPELMKGLGKGVKSFKDGVNGIENDLDPDKKEEAKKEESKK